MGRVPTHADKGAQKGVANQRRRMRSRRVLCALAGTLLAVMMVVALPQRMASGTTVPPFASQLDVAARPNLVRLLFEDGLGLSPVVEGSSDELATEGEGTPQETDAPQDADTVQVADDEATSAGVGEAAAGDAARVAESVTAQATEENADEPWVQTLEQVLTVSGTAPDHSDDKAYTVRVTYDDASGLPRDAELVLGAPAADDEHVTLLQDRLELDERETVVQSQFVSIELMSGGVAVQPVSQVKVEVETSAIDPEQSDAVQIVLLEDGGDETTALETQNFTGFDQQAVPTGDAIDLSEVTDKESPDPTTTRVRVATPRLGEMCIAVVAQQKFSWSMQGKVVSVLGPRALVVESYEMPLDVELGEGLRLMKAFGLRTNTTHAWVPALWLKLTPDEEQPDEAGTLLVYDVTPGSAPLVLAGRDASADAQLQPLAADGLYALAWESASEMSEAQVAQAPRSAQTLSALEGEGDGDDPAEDETPTATYTVKWVDVVTKEDGSTEEKLLLKQENIEEGTQVSYEGAVPTKEQDAQYVYAFEGWKPDPGLVVITQDTTFEALYTKTLRTYTVTWLDNTGATIETDQNVPYGSMPSFDGTLPEKQSTETADYSFSHWETSDRKPLGPVTGAVTYEPQYTTAPVQIYLRDALTREPLDKATFTLTNVATGKLVWRGVTSGGVVNIESKTTESELTGDTPGGATFEIGNTYTLKQTGPSSDDKHFVPKGSWTLEVKQGTEDPDTKVFSLTRVAEAGDLSTREASGPYGIRFYLENLQKSQVTYRYNYPSDVGAQQPPDDGPHDVDALQYDYKYTVTLKDPDDLTGANYEYEFAGWSVDGSISTVYQGEQATINTANNPSHTLTAAWRIPLHVKAQTIVGGVVSEVTDSEGTFVVRPEASRTFGDLAAVGVAYGEHNNAVQALAADKSMSFSSATITLENGTTRSISSLAYDASARRWQYRMAEGTSELIGIEKGDVLTLSYVSTDARVQRVVQDEDGTFTKLPTTQTTTEVLGEWRSTQELVAAADRPVVDDVYYYHYLGFGAPDATKASDLAKTGSKDFSLKNGAAGFSYREGSTGTGELLVGANTIYVIYATTPPEDSACLDIKNVTDWRYRVDAVYQGVKSEERDFVARGLAVVVDSTGKLSVLKKGTLIAKQGSLSLVLLGGGTGAFILGGGFADRSDNVPISVGIINRDKVTRTTIMRNWQKDDVTDTSSVTRGTLEGSTPVTVAFDNALRSLTVRKTWSEDAFPQDYAVDFYLYEDGRVCHVAEGTGGVYTLTSANADSAGTWTFAFANLPTRLPYTVHEKAIRERSAGGKDVSEDFTAVYNYDRLAGEGIIGIHNERTSSVCRVGTEEFRTIRAAMEHIKSSGDTTATIEMLTDYRMLESGSVTIPAGYDITLTTAAGLSDLTRATVTRNFNGSSDTFKVEGTLRLQNVELTGKVGSTRFAKEGNGGLVYVAGGTLEAGEEARLTSGSADNGSVVYVDGGSVTLAGAYVSDGRAKSGGAIGVASDACRIKLSGNTYVYNNHDGNGNGQRNVYLDKDSNEVIRVVGGGLGDSAQVGVYVPGSGTDSLYEGHGRPAMPFAKFETGASDNLNTLVNDRIASGDAHLGYASTYLSNTVVWGQTFSVTVSLQWLSDVFEQVAAPADARVTLTLTGGAQTPAAAVERTVTLGADDTYTFCGLARYDTEGKPYQYYVAETLDATTAETYRRVVFTADKGVKNNPLTYDSSFGAEGTDANLQHITVSNYQRYTNFTIEKVVKDDVHTQKTEVKSTFTVYRVPKSGADLTTDGSVRYFGVGGVSDLPLGLRAPSGPFSTQGANEWTTTVNGQLVTFHRFYDATFGEFTEENGTYTLGSGEQWQRGDVIRLIDGTCKVYAGEVAQPSWPIIATDFSVGYLGFSRQDGVAGVESVGGESAGASCTIEGDGTYVFKREDKKLSSDYYYYAVETSIQEKNNEGRGIAGTHKIVATYDPTYAYDQRNAKLTITNTHQDYLSVDKRWPEDATTFDVCTFVVYEVQASGVQVQLKESGQFEKLVKSNADAEKLKQSLKGVTGLNEVAEFKLPDEKNSPAGPEGSWVHVLKDETESGKIDPSKTYMVWESLTGSLQIMNPDVKDSSTKVDAVYAYDEKVNQITVRNMSAILCKVVDDNGDEHVFRRLNDAKQYGIGRSSSAGSNTEFAIEMLRDYNIPASDTLVVDAGQKITLTTATDGENVYKSDVVGKEKATITRRAGNATSFVQVKGAAENPADTCFTYTNIELDGANIGVSNPSNLGSRGSFVYATNATVEVRRSNASDAATGVVLKGARAANGGAIWADKSAVTVCYARFADCASTANGNDNDGGGAVYASGDLTVQQSTFERCTARNGGALYEAGGAGVTTYVDGCTFDACTASAYGGAVFARSQTLALDTKGVGTSRYVDCVTTTSGGGIHHAATGVSGSVTQVAGGAFEGCRATNSYGGGLYSSAWNLSVTGATFNQCVAKVRGGGLYHEKNTGLVATIASCTFTDCATESGTGDEDGGGGVSAVAKTMELRDCAFVRCHTSGRGGAVYHFNKESEQSTVLNCTFTDCTTTGGGGGAMHLKGKTQAITGCTFVRCEATSGAGGGVDIGSWNIDKVATVDLCEFEDCIAGSSQGGGICIGGSHLTVTRTSFKNCSATTNVGGAVAMMNQGNTEMVRILGCTFEDCTAPGNQGGAVYSVGKELILDSYVGEDKTWPTSFTNCSAKDSGGAVRQSKNVDESSVLAENVSFVNCHSTQQNDGGGLSSTAQTATIKSCTFANCTAIRWGGAVYTEAIYLDVVGTQGVTTFENCSSKNDGGAVCQRRNDREQAYARYSTCSFEDCASTGTSGGAIYTNVPHVVLDTVDFTNVNAWCSGGAVYNSSNGNYLYNAKFEVSDCSFNTCAAGLDGNSSRQGGAIYTNAQELTVTGVNRRTRFETCTTTQYGGAILMDRNSERSVANVSGADFVGCRSTASNGGALAIRATQLTVDDVTFEDCRSRGSGGAVCHEVNDTYLGMTVATITNARFTDDEAGWTNIDANGSGGGLYSNAKEVVVGATGSTVVFEGCTARGIGGALYHSRGGTVSSTTVRNVRFVSCSSSRNSGGAIHSYAASLDVDASAFSGCTAANDGGALRHDNNNTVSALRVGSNTFDSCKAGASGGAISANVTTITVDGATFDDCATTGTGSGGALFHSLSKNEQISPSSVTVTGSTFAGCVATTGSGGGIYTSAKALSVTGRRGTTTFDRCTSYINGGGAVRHDRDVEGSSTTLAACTLNGCASKNSDGGGVWSKARQLVMRSCVLTGCTARSSGGGIFHSGNLVGSFDLLYDCTVTGCVAEVNHGGGLATYTRSLTLTNSTFSGCTAQQSGGCVYHYPNTGSSVVPTATITNCQLTGGIATKSNGGGLYVDQAQLAMTGSTVSGCAAGYRGGGVYVDNRSSCNRPATLDSCAVADNTATNAGGGIYYNASNELTLRNGTSITGNRLGVTNVDYAAGVWMDDNASTYLVLGERGRASDTITVSDNLTGAGEKSNLRLPKSNVSTNGRKNNRNTAVLLLSNLVRTVTGAGGTIGVCNPGAKNTRFGQMDVAGHTGMENILSDIDTLRGRLDDADLEKRALIWFAPPICKITDQSGLLLTYGDGISASFDSLAEAFAVVNNLTKDYIKDDTGTTPPQIQIQMLVDGFVQTTKLPALKRSVTITTAEVNEAEPDNDLYYHGQGKQATVTRGSNVTGPLIEVAEGVELSIKGLKLDGGGTQAKPITANADGALVYVRSDGVLRLGRGATLQNSIAGEGRSGGAVYVTGGSDPSKVSLYMDEDAAILNCSATNGGAVYLTPGALFSLNDKARLEGNEAKRAGGAVYVSDGAAMRMADNAAVVIRNNRVSDPAGMGAGVYLGSSDAKLYLRLRAGSSFANNYIEGTESTTRKNGGASYPRVIQDIYLGESADQANSIVLTGNLSARSGSLYVWAERPNHYVGDAQFAVMGDGVQVSDVSLAVFHDARDDNDTNNQSGDYYTGVRNPTDATDCNVYWGNYVGVEVAFLKIDGYGEALDGATFTLYSNPAGTDGSEVLAAVSGEADGERGVVRFGKLPQGVYFMRESAEVPDGVATNDTTYIVLVGDMYLNLDRLRETDAYAGYFPATGDVLVTQELINAQDQAQMELNGRHKHYAVFPLVADGDALVAAPAEIVRYGLINTSDASRRLLLRKVNEEYDGLKGAAFIIYNADWTVRDTDVTSDEDGILLLDELPLGTYYLQETTAPSGYGDNKGSYYVLRVDEGGATVSDAKKESEVKALRVVITE